MKARTKKEKRIEVLATGLKELSPAMRQYATKRVGHVGFQDRKTVHCISCGHSWRIDQEKKTARCPHCNKILKVTQSAKRKSKECYYVAYLQRVKEFQVIRYFLLTLKWEKNHGTERSFDEVAQVWFDEYGNSHYRSKPRTMSFYYRDSWIMTGKMALRRSIPFLSPWVTKVCSVVPSLRRQGLKSGLHDLDPFHVVQALWDNSQAETIYKAGYFSLFDARISRAGTFERFDQEEWAAVKICIRNGFKLGRTSEARDWCDMVKTLCWLGKDVHNSHYVCPEDLASAHSHWNEVKIKRMREEKKREMRQRIMAADSIYQQTHGAYMGVVITDGVITIRPLQSVMEFFEEGEMMHHCVFANEYYRRQDSLILSAQDANGRLETIEVSLERMKVVQSRGRFNRPSKLHDRIVKLVESNMARIKNCVADDGGKLKPKKSA